MAIVYGKGSTGRLEVRTPMGTVFTAQAGAGRCEARIRWNKDAGASLASAMTTARSMLMQRILRDTDPLVPFDTGMLKNTAQLATDYDSGEIIWSTPYARPQYYLHEKGTALHGDTGLRGSWWAERSRDAHKISWEQFYKKAVKEVSG